MQLYMRHIIICGLSGCTPFFHIISQTARFSGKKVIEHKMCVLIFCTAFVRNTSHSKKTERDMIMNVEWSSCRVPVIFVQFKWNLIFLYGFSKNTERSNFMKIGPVVVDQTLWRRNKSRSSTGIRNPDCLARRLVTTDYSTSDLRR